MYYKLLCCQLAVVLAVASGQLSTRASQPLENREPFRRRHEFQQLQRQGDVGAKSFSNIVMTGQPEAPQLSQLQDDFEKSVALVRHEILRQKQLQQQLALSQTVRPTPPTLDVPKPLLLEPQPLREVEPHTFRIHVPDSPTVAPPPPPPPPSLPTPAPVLSVRRPTSHMDLRKAVGDSSFRTAVNDQNNFRQTVNDQNSFRNAMNDQNNFRQTVNDQTNFRQAVNGQHSVRKAVDHVESEDERMSRKQAESARYTFNSAVNDGIYDNMHVREETRDGLKVTGLYSYSDGFYKRTVHYEADENGYRVVKEETEPIGDGPLLDLKGFADVSSSISGVDNRYQITAADISTLIPKSNKRTEQEIL